MKDENCNKALSTVVADIIFKIVKRFNKIFIDSTALGLKCFGLRHLACLTIMDFEGLQSNSFAAAASRKLKHFLLNLVTSAEVTRPFHFNSNLVSSVAKPRFNSRLLEKSPFSTDQVD